MISREEIIAHHDARRLKFVVTYGSQYISDNPLDFAILSLVAEAYLNLRFVGEAQKLYQILYDQQRTPRHITGLGLANSSSGDFKSAKALFKEALMQDPDYLPAWSGLTEIHRFSRHDPVLKRLEKTLNRAKKGSKLQGGLCYLMCKAMNDIGKFSAAWQYAEKGAALVGKDATDSFLTSSLTSWTRDQEEIATRTLLQGDLQTEIDSAGLVFIVGMPRSGTSLLETLLSNAPRVLGCGELCFVSDVARSRLKSVNPAQPGSTHSWLQNWSMKERVETAKAYVDDLRARTGGAKYDHFVDKFPGNIICLPHIAMLFPKAKILRMHRNPMDSCISNYLGQFSGGNTFTYDINHLAETYAAYQSCADSIIPRLPNPVMDVNYENLVGAPETELRNILQFLGIDWSQDCLSPELSTTPCVTRSRGQVRSKISRQAVGRWRNYGKLAAPLAAALTAQGIDIGEAATLLGENPSPSRSSHAA